MILSWWLWITYLKWLISFLIERPLMQIVSPNFFFREILPLHGLSHSIISRQDTKFICCFRWELWKWLKINIKLNSTYHLQTDGQTKVMNHNLNNMLRCVVTEQHQSWDDILGQVEFAYNSTLNWSTSCSPFNIVYTKEPNHTIDLAILLKKKKFCNVITCDRFQQCHSRSLSKITRN